MFQDSKPGSLDLVSTNVPFCFSEMTSFQTLQTSHVPWTHSLRPPAGFKDTIILHRVCTQPHQTMPVACPITCRSPGTAWLCSVTVVCLCLCLGRPVNLGQWWLPGLQARPLPSVQRLEQEGGGGAQGCRCLEPAPGRPRCPRGSLPQAWGREPSWAGWGRAGECRPGGKATFLLTEPMC